MRKELVITINVIGQQGAGKRAIVHAIANLIHDHNLPVLIMDSDGVSAEEPDVSITLDDTKFAWYVVTSTDVAPDDVD